MNAADDLAMLFQEVVLILGGAFALHPVSDEMVRRVAAGLERAYGRAVKRRSETKAVAPHPAITKLLRIASRGTKGR